METVLCAVTDSRQCQTLRSVLEDQNLLRQDCHIKKLTDALVAVPVLDHIVNHDSFQRNMDGEFNWNLNRITFVLQDVEVSCKAKRMGQLLHRKLSSVLREKLERRGVLWAKKLENDIPLKWEKHGDLVLIHGSSFQEPEWKQLGTSLWDLVAEVLSAKRLAKKYRIEKNGFRTPYMELLRGEDSWVTKMENGIKYSWDVSQCMFSPGNISEKLRVSKMNCLGEIVVDLYAGIGYFTLPYLIHAKAKLVHACEWNPAAVHALHFNVKQNGVEDRCVIHEGDNRQVCPVGVADRVNVGLIPSSAAGWPVACQALQRDSGGVLHIHGNVESGQCLLMKDSNASCNPVGTESSTDPSKRIAPDIVHVQDCESEVPELQAGVVEDKDHVQMMKVKCKRKEWGMWATETAAAVQHILEDLHREPWTVEILHLEHVKSYAAHVNHLVADLHCKPYLQDQQ